MLDFDTLVALYSGPQTCAASILLTAWALTTTPKFLFLICINQGPQGEKELTFIWDQFPRWSLLWNQVSNPSYPNSSFDCKMTFLEQTTRASLEMISDSVWHLFLNQRQHIYINHKLENRANSSYKAISKPFCYDLLSQLKVPGFMRRNKTWCKQIQTGLRHEAVGKRDFFLQASLRDCVPWELGRLGRIPPSNYLLNNLMIASQISLLWNYSFKF